MTRKDYQLIAAAVARTKARLWAQGEGTAPARELACELADSFGEDNPRFDRCKFLNACLSARLVPEAKP